MIDGEYTKAGLDGELGNVTAADKRVWGTSSGMQLTCIKHLVMTDSGEQAFTEGKNYKVLSMHPIAVPAYVRVIDDQGDSHTLNGDHLREYFGL
jgi:hypothetical protein